MNIKNKLGLILTIIILLFGVFILWQLGIETIGVRYFSCLPEIRTKTHCEKDSDCIVMCELCGACYNKEAREIWNNCEESPFCFARGCPDCLDSICICDQTECKNFMRKKPEKSFCERLSDKDINKLDTHGPRVWYLLDTNESLKEICYDEYYLDEAKKNKDPNACSKIINDLERDKCYKYVASEIKNFSLCEKMVDSDNKNSCLARQNKNATFCEKISKQYSRDECFYDVALLTDDSQLCAKIANNNRQGWCCMELAEKMKDDSICACVRDVQMRDNCYLGMAPKVRDAEICKKIENEEKMSKCLKDVEEYPPEL